MYELSKGQLLTSEKKSDSTYGLKAAKRIASTTGTNIGVWGYNNYVQHIQLYDLAQGRASTQDLRNMGSFLGHRENAALKNMGFGNLDVQEVNIMPHFVNLVHGKIMEMDYDIGVDAIDPLSLDRKKQVEQMLRAFVRLKKDFSSIGATFEKISKETGITELPDTEEDVEMLMSTSYKSVDAMKAELEMKKVHNVNRWPAIKSKLVMDNLVIGPCCLRVFVDKYGRIREEHIAMHKVVTSYSETEDYDNLTYAGHLELLTYDQFVCEAGGDMTEAEMKEVFEKCKGQSGMGMIPYSDSEQRILVLRFQLLEEDKVVMEEGSDKYGNTYIIEVDANMEVKNEDMPLYQSGQRKRVTETVQGKYGGNWVVGSEKVYGYGLIQQGHGLMLDYILYAPNMRYGKFTSMVSQGRELTMMLSVAWTKLKEVIGKGYSGPVKLNYNALVKTIETKGGQTLDWADRVDLFIQQNIILETDNVNEYQQKINDAITIVDGGVAINDFVMVVNLCIQLVGRIFGINDLSEGTTPKAGTLDGVFDKANQATNTNLSHYFRAYNSVYTRASLAILNHWKAGATTDEWLGEYVIGSEAATTKEEWQVYNTGIAKLVTVPLLEGGLTATDSMELSWPNVKNLKEAIWMVKNRVRANMKNAQGMQMQMAQQQQQAAMQQQQMAAQAQQQAIIMEDKLLRERLLMEYNLKMQLQDKVNEGAESAKHIQAISDLIKTRQQGADSILKAQTMNQSDQAIQASKNEMHAFETSVDANLREAEMMLKKATEDKKSDSKKAA